MKRILPLLLALCLLLSACGGKSGATKTPEELTEAYTQAITAAQDEEENEAFPVMSDTDDQLMVMAMQVMGLAQEDVSALAVATSLRNIQAYAIAAVMPAEGKEDAVKSALEGYIETQKSSFEFYLEEQYQVASDAKLEKLKDGTLLLVMCKGQDEVFQSVKSALEK